jgi:non-specific serine/threonine protein kinase/serine/threonine-protein kinase
VSGFLEGLSKDQMCALDGLLDEVLDALPEAREALLLRIAAAQPDLAEPLGRMLGSLQGDSPLQRSPVHRAEHIPQSAAVHELAPGSRLGPWRIETLAGRGGMASVYRAHRDDGSFAMTVAVKLLQSDAARQAERFQRERDLLARLDHPHIARLIDGGLSKTGTPYLVMSWVDGEDLDVHLQRAKLPLAARLALFKQIGGAVAYAHQQLVVHRDLKPGNVRVTPDGRAVLLDFGIARLTDELAPLARTQAIFTPGYAAPEQLRAEPISTLTDVYALGTLLFVMLAAEHPFPQADDSLAAAVQAICGTDAPAVSSVAAAADRAALRGDLDAIIARCLRKSPAARYPSVSALLDDLDRYASGQPVQARAATHWYRGRRFLRRHWLSTGLATLAGISMIGGLIGVTWQAQIARGERDIARREAQRQDALREHLMLIFREGAAQGGNVTAKQMLDASATQLATLYGDDPALRRSVLLALGELYFTLGDMPAARSLLERFVEQTAGDTSTADLALAQHQLAQVLLRQGELTEAEARLEAAEALQQRLPPRPSRLRAQILNTRSALLRLRGDTGQGVELQKRAVALIELANDAGPLDVGVAQSNLGIALLQRLELDEARYFLERALQTWGDAGLQQSTNAVTTLGNLGSLALLAGNYAEAEANFQRARSITEAGQSESAAFGGVLSNLARTLLIRGRAEEAAPLAERAAELTARLTGANTPDLAGVMLTRAEIALALGQTIQARELAQQADAIFRSRLGSDHPLTQRAALSLAQIDAVAGAADAPLRLDALAAQLTSAPPLLRRQAVRGRLWAAEAWLRQGNLLKATGSSAAAAALAPTLHLAPAEGVEIAFWTALAASNPSDASDALRQLEAIFGAAHPRMRQLRGRLPG